MKKILSLLLVSTFFAGATFAQSKDKAKFKEYEPGYYQNFILKDVNHVKKERKDKKMDKRFQMDQSGMVLGNNMELYKENTAWHNPTISQGNGGTCWCFSTTSFVESELYRQTGKKIKLSEMYTVYWEYVEKARGFVQKRGNSHFSEGSEGNAVARMYKKYGTVPESVYNGLPNDRKFHSHNAMFKEMNNYLQSVKKSNAWNEEEVLSTIKSIMNHHIGVPPTEFNYNGKTITPKEYMNIIGYNSDDYVEILSYKQEPYWKQVEYSVEDNWWHSKEYYNVPLDVYMDVVKESIRKGYTMSIGGDVSEAGFLRTTNCAMVPTFDIASKDIDENARQFRFSNHTTTDDHGMHLVGYTEIDGKDWYLVKDSSSGSRNVGEESPIFGYYFFTEDYMKLKMMGFTIHKDAVKKILKKFK
ncbi:MAG: C1 family peptidase [Bacteroidota bacterium]|nr:C1 family peptidase [Bacteroidota bacterium]